VATVRCVGRKQLPTVRRDEDRDVLRTDNAFGQAHAEGVVNFVSRLNVIGRTREVCADREPGARVPEVGQAWYVYDQARSRAVDDRTAPSEQHRDRGRKAKRPRCQTILRSLIIPTQCPSGTRSSRRAGQCVFGDSCTSESGEPTGPGRYSRPMPINLGRKILAVAALAVVVAAVAFTLVPFSDRGTQCGSAVQSARHGKFGSGPSEQFFGSDTPFLPGPPATVCKGPARTRLALSSAAIMVATIALAVGWHVFDTRRDAQRVE
jgi:hypothetical protein